MNQIELMVTCQNMEPGQRLNVSDSDMRQAASGSIKSLLFDGPVRESDVAAFVDQIQQNWGVSVRQNLMSGEWVVSKR